MNEKPLLLAAARKGDYESLNLLLDRGEDPNQTNATGETALILAVQRGCEKSVRRLLQAGADPLKVGGDPTGCFRHNAAGFANRQARLPIIQMLLDAIKLDSFQNIAWYRSCSGENGYTSLYDEAMMRVENITCQPTSIETLHLLIQAIYRDDFAMFKEQLKKGADIHTLLSNGLAPLHLAIRHHRHAMFDALIECGAKIDLRATPYCYSPLFVAVHAQNAYAFRRLMDLGAKDLPTSEQHTALFAAVYRNDLAAMQELIARGSDLKQYARDGYYTLVYAAARYKHIDALKILLSHGLHPDMKPHSQQNMNFDMYRTYQLTPLSAAVKNGDAAMVELLLQAGADPNRESSGIPPLFFAIPIYRFPEDETGNFQKEAENYCVIIELLIRHGADPHKRAQDGTDCLSYAILSGQEEIAIRLLRLGASGTLKDKQVKLPIEHARARNQAKVVAYLEQGARGLNALEMLKQFLRECLQPILAALGYRNDENTWWVDQGDKVNLIHLQIFPWSTSQKLDFCICKGTASKGKLKYAQGDMRNPIPLASYLPESRHQRPYRNHMGYSINDKTDFAEFLYEIRNDLELIKGEL